MARDLQKRALDSLIEQTLARVVEADGDETHHEARIIAPGARFDPIDERYVGRLIDLLNDAFPDTPAPLFSRVRPDLIVVLRDYTPPSIKHLVRFADSRLRVAKPHQARMLPRKRMYSETLNMNVERGRHLETDMINAAMVFNESFFSPRSFKAWARLSRDFARMCAIMLEAKTLAGLSQRELIRTDGRNTSLVPASIQQTVKRDGESVDIELELTRAE